MITPWAPYIPKRTLATVFPTQDILLNACITYFDECNNTVIRRTFNTKGAVLDEYTRPFTLTGLALHLGLSRIQLVNYSFNDTYGDIILWARAKCENYIEEGMLVGRLNTIGSIFNLKNNYGWKDKTEVDNTLTLDRVDTNNLKELSTNELRKLVISNGERTIDLVLAAPEATEGGTVSTAGNTESATF